MVNWKIWCFWICLLIVIPSLFMWSPRKQYFCEVYCDEHYEGKKIKFDDKVIYKCETKNVLVDKKTLIEDDDGFFEFEKTTRCVDR